MLFGLLSQGPQNTQNISTEKHLCTRKNYTCATWPYEIGQQIPCFDRCQLTITWTSNIKEEFFKTRLHVSVDMVAGVFSPSCPVVSVMNIDPQAILLAFDN